MTQEKLNHVILLHTHKEITDNIDVKEIAIDKEPTQNEFFTVQH